VGRPRIGITSYATRARWTHWDLPVSLLPQGYIEGVRLAGGAPLLLPPTAEGAEGPGDLLDGLHGLVLTGGPDIGAERYGEEPHETADRGHDLRDAFELALALEAERRRMPVLGICRGMRLLNVARGGALDQHLGDSIDMTPHRPVPGTFGEHGVAVERGTRLHQLVGDRVDVRSHHHQGVSRLGDGLTVTAAADDGTIEAFEDAAMPFCLGVLWHPEEHPDTSGAPLFRGLVEAAAAYRDGST